MASGEEIPLDINKSKPKTLSFFKVLVGRRNRSKKIQPFFDVDPNSHNKKFIKAQKKHQTFLFLLRS